MNLRKPTVRDVCKKCGKAVYALEKIQFGELTFHENCCRCTICNVKVIPGKHNENEGHYYCKTHMKTVENAKSLSRSSSKGMANSKSQPAIISDTTDRHIRNDTKLHSFIIKSGEEKLQMGTEQHALVGDTHTFAVTHVASLPRNREAGGVEEKPTIMITLPEESLDPHEREEELVVGVMEKDTNHLNEGDDIPITGEPLPLSENTETNGNTLALDQISQPQEESQREEKIIHVEENPQTNQGGSIKIVEQPEKENETVLLRTEEDTQRTPEQPTPKEDKPEKETPTKKAHRKKSHDEKEKVVSGEANKTPEKDQTDKEPSLQSKSKESENTHRVKDSENQSKEKTKKEAKPNITITTPKEAPPEILSPTTNGDAKHRPKKSKNPKLRKEPSISTVGSPPPRPDRPPPTSLHDHTSLATTSPLPSPRSALSTLDSDKKAESIKLKKNEKKDKKKKEKSKQDLTASKDGLWEGFNKDFPLPELVKIDSKYNTLRDKQAYEFLSTEYTYVKTLQTTLYIFGRPLLVYISKGEITDHKNQSLKTIFSTMETLVRTNTMLLESLLETFKNWNDKSCFGHHIIKIAPFLKGYKDYLDNFDDALSWIAKLSKKNKVLSNLLETVHSHPLNTRNISPQSLLIEPVQRLPRYPMLLRSLTKETPVDHPDYTQLTTALENVEKISKTLDKAIEDAKNRMRVAEIQSYFGSEQIMMPARLLLQEGDARVSGSKDKEYRLYLFNDIFLYAQVISKEKETIYKDAKIIPLQNLTCIGDEKEYSFTINTFKNSNEFVRFETQTTEERNMWVQKFKSASTTAKQLATKRSETIAKIDTLNPTDLDTKKNPRQSGLRTPELSSTTNLRKEQRPKSAVIFNIPEQLAESPPEGELVKNESKRRKWSVDTSELTSVAVETPLKFTPKPVEDPKSPTVLLRPDFKPKNTGIWELLMDKDDPAKLRAAIQAGAKLNVIHEILGVTPLGLVIQEQNEALFRELVTSKGIDINFQDRDGNTPLHVASQENKPEYVSLLLSLSARTDITNKNLKTPHEVADPGTYQIWSVWQKGGLHALESNEFPSFSELRQNEKKSKKIIDKLKVTKIMKSKSMKYEVNENSNVHFDVVNVDPKYDSLRDKAAIEIMTTELTYVKGLHTTLLVYGDPIQAAFANGNLPQEIASLNKTFKTMNQIFKANSELLLSLQTKFKNWDENQTIGEVLCAMAPWLRVYNEYLVTFDDALAALQNKNKVLQQIMESGSTHPINSRHLPLQAFLIEPVQRLPRYPLLIKALIKLTPQNHPDYAFLDKADKEFSEIASIMDEAIESSRNATKIVELQNSFLDLTIVQPHRIYVCEIEVLWSIEKDSKKTQAKMYMFNDAILIADKKLFPTLPEEVSIGDIPDSDSFSVHLNIKNPPYTADLIAETTEDAKKKWMRKYSSVMDKLLLSPRGLKKL